MIYTCLRQKSKKVLSICIFFYLFWAGSFSLAAPLPNPVANILVLVDASHSMSETDPDGITKEIAKMFVDLSYKEKINMGIHFIKVGEIHCYFL